MLWPTYSWERADPTDPATSWEAYRNCIGAMNSLHALSGDQFVGYCASARPRREALATAVQMTPLFQCVGQM
eukprot:SAG11_NODE_872_length_6802_cov_8.951514_4_plen_72_part_00